MRSERFLDAGKKLDRAEALLKDLNNAIDAFFGLEEPRPYAFVDEQASDGRWVRRCYIKRPLPDFGLVIGDVLHNTRSALDHLIQRLVIERLDAGIVKKADISRGSERVIGFPTHDYAKDLPALIKKKVQLAGGAAMDLVTSTEPYEGGKGHALWQLDALDVIDKHRVILAAAGSLVRVSTEQAPSFPPLVVSRHGIPFIASGGIVFAHEDYPMTPLEDGTIVWGPSAKSLAELRIRLRLRVEITLTEALVAKPEPVSQTLKGFIAAVDDVLKSFASLPNPVP